MTLPHYVASTSSEFLPAQDQGRWFGHGVIQNRRIGVVSHLPLPDEEVGTVHVVVVRISNINQMSKCDGSRIRSLNASVPKSGSS